MGRTRNFGLIGYPLGHSLSPLIHERIMAVMGISGKYKLYEIDPKSLPAELPKLLESLDGFNCTIPHKVDVIPFLDRLAPSATIYGAVNTVYGRTGHNTDGAGFAACQVPMAGRKVCILGAGGVARVLVMEACRAGAREIVIKARNLQRAEELADEMKKHGCREISVACLDGDPVEGAVFLNGTPVGMWPEVGQVPLTPGEIGRAEAVYDTIYNPTATRLVLQAKSRKIWAQGGLEMLFEQALEAQKIWNPELDFDRHKTEWERLRQGLAEEVLRIGPVKLVLTGFMGSGKTHIGRMLAAKASLSFVDLDDLVAARAGQSITDIFTSQGEDAFRRLEREVFQEQLHRPEAMVLATGGGTLLQDGMVEAVRSAAALVIYLEASLETALARIATGSSRPLLGQAERLYKLRRPLYEKTADFTVAAGGEDREAVEAIMTAFGWRL
ncbi:MAG: NAD(P)-binding domain-containing protein [Firmicutes bacterium]|nr:NAD(P)-binding domain-containing protein [Bacillota bacterium]